MHKISIIGDSFLLDDADQDLTSGCLYLDLSPRHSDLFYWSAARPLQEHHPQWLRNALTLKVE